MRNESESEKHDRAILYALLIGAALLWVNYLWGVS